MRIALFHPWIKSYGGAEKLVLEYAKRSKYDIDIYTWFYNPNRTFKEYKYLNVRSIFPIYIDKISRTFLFRGAFFSFIGNIKKVLPEEDYDLILISTAGIAETTLLRYNSDIPVVLYVHTPLRAAYPLDIIFNFKNRFRKNPIAKYYYKFGIHIYNRIEKKAWSKAHFATFNSHLTLKRALDKKLIDINKTKVIYPGVDVNIEPGDYGDYFLYVARFGMAKRQDVVLLAWKIFSKKYPEYKLILAGSKENKKYFDYLVKLKEQLKLTNVVFVTDSPYEMIKNLHSNALAEIQVPFMEDFGIAPFEAVVAEKPLIAVDSMGALELLRMLPSIIKIKESINKVKLAIRLARAMELFIKHKDEYIERAIDAKNKLNLDYLSWDRFTKDLDATLASIVSNR